MLSTLVVSLSPKLMTISARLSVISPTFKPASPPYVEQLAAPSMVSVAELVQWLSVARSEAELP